MTISWQDTSDIYDPTWTWPDYSAWTASDADDDEPELIDNDPVPTDEEKH